MAIASGVATSRPRARVGRLAVLVQIGQDEHRLGVRAGGRAGPSATCRPRSGSRPTRPAPARPRDRRQPRLRPAGGTRPGTIRSAGGAQGRSARSGARGSRSRRGRARGSCLQGWSSRLQGASRGRNSHPRAVTDGATSTPSSTTLSSTAIAALWPATPLTPPPRRALAPQMNMRGWSVSTPQLPTSAADSAHGQARSPWKMLPRGRRRSRSRSSGVFASTHGRAVGVARQAVADRLGQVLVERVQVALGHASRGRRRCRRRTAAPGVCRPNSVSVWRSGGASGARIERSVSEWQ